MGYAKQRTRLEALELTNRRAMYAHEQATVKDLADKFQRTKEALKGELARVYTHCFHHEASEFRKAKQMGFEDHWRKASAAVVSGFLHEAAVAFNKHLNTNWKEEVLRQCWALDMTTPAHIRVKVPQLRRAQESAIEGIVTIAPRADWLTRWAAWISGYADNVTRNVNMATFDGADLEAMLKKVDSTKVGQPSVDVWAALERMARTEMLYQQQGARDEAMAANGELVEEEVWQTMEDTSVCEICADNLGSTRTDASDDIPVHPNCRCFWRLVPKEFGELMRSDPEAAAALDERGIAPDALVIWDAEHKEIKAMAVVDFEEWKNEEGRNNTYGNSI